MSLGLALVQPDLLEQQVGQLAFVNVITRSPEPFSLLIPEDCGEFST